MTSDTMCLIERFLLGDADEVELRQMLARVRESEDFASELRDVLEGDVLLRIAGREADGWSREQDLMMRVLAANPESIEQRIEDQIRLLPTPQRVPQRKPAVRFLVAVAAAAAAIAIGMWWQAESGVNERDDAPTPIIAQDDVSLEVDGVAVASFGVGQDVPVGMFAQNVLATWAGDPPHPKPGYAVESRTYELVTGLTEIHLPDSRVVVEGPAKFRVTDADRLEMQWGRVTVSVNDGGFIVATPSTDVVDVSTVFAVETSPGGDTEVHVLEGEVAAVAPGKGRDFSKAVHIEEGYAGIFREWQPLDQEPLMPNEGLRFAASLRPCVGVRELRGLLRQVNDLPSMDRTWMDRSDILISLERKEFPVPEKIGLTRTGSGRFVGDVKPHGMLRRGVIVNSYMLQLGPGDWITEHQAEGVVRFDHEIIGVIFDDAGLEGTDRFFSEDPLNLRDRGLEEGDVVEISSDRRSVYLDLRTVGVKQVRILTETE